MLSSRVYGMRGSGDIINFISGSVQGRKRVLWRSIGSLSPNEFGFEINLDIALGKG